MSTPVHIELTDLKALRSFSWAPTGVCALVGPNGAGKSTALRVFDLLRIAIERGFADAIRETYGGGELLNRDASERLPRVRVQLDSAQWRIDLERAPRTNETAHDGAAVIRRTPKAINTRAFEFVDATGGIVMMPAQDVEADVSLKILQQRPDLAPRLVALARRILASRYYSRPDLTHLRIELSADDTDPVLDTHSRSLFSVLRTWMTNSSEHDEQFKFVIEAMRELFPGFVSLDTPALSQRVSAKAIFANKQKFDPSDWSDGFFCCLSMLTALASVRGGVVAIDEPENSLHPELIRRLIEFMREWSRKNDTTVVLASHSPVLLNEFRSEPEQVFVMQSGAPQLPVRLDELKKRDWLEHFSLGDLYTQNEVGAPAQ